MLFSETVRRDLEREVLGHEFNDYFERRLREAEPLAAFASPAALLEFLQRDRSGSAGRDAVLVALLRAYDAAARDRARVGALLLLALWRDLRPIVLGKTRQLARSAGFSRTDADDIEQGLVLDVLQRLPRFDPTRASLRTFITRLVDHHVASVLERRSTTRRDWRRCRESLQDVVEDGTGGLSPRWRTLEPTECRERRGIGSMDEAALRDLQMDVAAAIDDLPPDLRVLAERLLHATPREVSRATGIPDSTVRDGAARIGRAFARRGLARFLRTARDPATGSGMCPRERT